MTRRARFLVLTALAGAGIVGAWRLDTAGDAARDAGIETSRIRGWARARGGAGPSVLPKRVPAADPRELRQLESLPGFHAYAMRCSSCHVLPDPAAYPADRWIGKVDEMREHIRRAGVMPPSAAELDSVRSFLRAASDALLER
jgi:mono/diheme cytochrome c family protein